MRRGMALFLEGVAKSTGQTQPGHASLQRASARLARAWNNDLLSGYRQQPTAILTPLAATRSRELVAVRDIAFSSICKHHLLPFEGRVHIGYAPLGRITGLSRLGRLVDCLARRLQLQETLTREIVDAVQENLTPAGVACIVEAHHSCFTARGSRKPTSRIVTAAFSGVFDRNARKRRELLLLLGRIPPEKRR
ncbi:MAG: GTP cyclohydrolase I [Acidobacteriota bacterium]